MSLVDHFTLDSVLNLPGSDGLIQQATGATASEIHLTKILPGSPACQQLL